MVAKPDADDTEPEDEVTEAKAEFKACEEAFAANYRDALDDLRFARLAEQWPEAVRSQREQDGRPCLTINRLPAFIRQVVNDARQNKPAITVHPVDSQADPQTAEVMDGLIRHIEQSSDAEVAYDTALDFACSAGFGYFGVNTRYATDDGFEQDLIIERKPNPLAIYGDPESSGADSADWNIAFELETMTSEAFKRRWKGADPVSFEHDRYTKGDVPEARITVAARWKRETAMRQIAALCAPDPQQLGTDQLSAAMSLFDPTRMVVDLQVYEANKELFDALGMSVQGQPRDVPTFKVTQSLLSGAEELETNPWAGKYIPIIPVYGEEIHVQGKRHFRSLIRDAKDPQRMFNYWRTASTELVALAPKAPFVGPAGAFVTDAAKWATANNETHAYIEYDTRDSNGQPITMPPQRQQFAGPPAGALQEAINASDDIKSILGMFDASLGAQGNEISGRAILARQREGDVGTYHIIDNLSRAIRHCGRVVIDLIPHVYSTPRIIRTIGADGTASAVQIAPAGQQPPPLTTSNATAAGPMQPQQPNPAQQQELQQIARVFDLTAGKYDLTVTAGPSYTTRREEAANQMIELIRAYPQVAPVIGDLLAKNLDWPGADEIAERLHALLPQVLQGENPVVDQLKSQMTSLGQALGAAKAQIVQMEMDKSLEATRVRIEEFDAETARIKAVAPKGVPLTDPNDIAALVIKTLQDALQNPDSLFGAQQGQPPAQPSAAPPQPGSPGPMLPGV